MDCRDLNCAAHGRMLRRIRRLVLAVVALRTENARLRWDPVGVPVLDIHAADPEAERARYAAAVEAWHTWSRSAARDERARGWDRAHTMLCPNTQCREHRNPWWRTRGAT